MKFELK